MKLLLLLIYLFIVGTVKNQHYEICKKSLQILYLQKFEFFLIFEKKIVKVFEALMALGSLSQLRLPLKLRD